MTMSAAAFALLAAATISSPKVGTFFTRPDWMPREVESRDTVGSADTYWPWEEVWTNYNRVTHFFTPRRIGSNETASVYALMESMMERLYAVCAGDAPCLNPAFGPVEEPHFDFRIFAFRDYGYPVKAPDGVFVYDPPQMTNQYVETCVLTGQTVVVTNTVPRTDHTNRTAYLRFAEGNNLVRMRQAFTNWLNDGMGPFGDPMRPATNAAGVVTGWSGGAHFTTVAPFDAPSFLVYDFFKPFDGGPFFDFAPNLVGSKVAAGPAMDEVTRKPGYYFAATADLPPKGEWTRIYPPICLADELLTQADGKIHPWFGRGVPVINWERTWRYRSAAPLYGKISFNDITAYRAMPVDGGTGTGRFGTGIGGSVLDPSVADAHDALFRRLWSDELAAMNQRMSMFDTAVKACDDIPPSVCSVINWSEARCIRTVRTVGHGSYDGFSGYYDISSFDRDTESETNTVENYVTGPSLFRAHALLYRDLPRMDFSERSSAGGGYRTAPMFNDESDIEMVLNAYFDAESLRGKDFEIRFEDLSLSGSFMATLSVGGETWRAEIPWEPPALNDSTVSLHYSAAITRWVEAHLTTNFCHRITPSWPGSIARQSHPDLETSAIALFGIARRVADVGMQYPEECVMSNDRDGSSTDVMWSVGSGSIVWRKDGGESTEDSLSSDLENMMSWFKDDHKQSTGGHAYDDIKGMTQDPAEDVAEIFEGVKEQFWPTRIPMSIREESIHVETYSCTMDADGFVTINDEDFTPGVGTLESDGEIVRHGPYADPCAGRWPAYQIDAMLRVGTAARFNFNTLRRKD